MELCGIKINCHHLYDILELNSCKLLVTVNAEAIVRAQKEKRLAQIINNNYASIDGQIPLWLYKLKHKNIKIEKLSGSDLIYDISNFAEHNNLQIFLLGGKQNSNLGAITMLKKYHPKLKINGFSPDYSPYPFNNNRMRRNL